MRLTPVKQTESGENKVVIEAVKEKTDRRRLLTTETPTEEVVATEVREVVAEEAVAEREAIDHKPARLEMSLTEKATQLLLRQMAPTDSSEESQEVPENTTA